MLIAGNWKMYKWPSETAAFCRGIAATPGVDVVVCPPFTSLHEAVPTGLTVYAQNVHWEAEGAFTGEVSAKMLLDIGVQGSIVGHSERRQHFGELDAAVGLKARAALKAGLSPIVCVGETERERDAGETFGRIDAQLAGALESIAAADATRVVIAYEPVWAIGTGRTATPAQAQEVHRFLRGRLEERWGQVAAEVRIQYGGSVKPENAAELMGQPDIDGALVGGASLKADSFVAIVKGSRAG